MYHLASLLDKHFQNSAGTKKKKAEIWSILFLEQAIM